MRLSFAGGARTLGEWIAKPSTSGLNKGNAVSYKNVLYRIYEREVSMARAECNKTLRVYDLITGVRRIQPDSRVIK